MAVAQVKDVGNDWKRFVVAFKIEACRTGWRGAWDALRSAVTGDNRLTVLQDVTLSAYVKPTTNGADVNLSYDAQIAGVQVEEGAFLK